MNSAKKKQNSKYNKEERLLPEISNYNFAGEDSINFTKEDFGEFSVDIKTRTVCNMSVSSIMNSRSHYFGTISKHGNSIAKLHQMMENNENNYESKLIFNKNSPPDSIYKSKYNNYHIIKCNLITTIFVDNFIFSLFTNPSQVEKINCLFLENKNLNFKVNEEFLNILKNKKFSLDYAKNIEFIAGVNDMFNTSDYIQINSDFYRKKLKNIIYCVLVSFIFLLLGFVNFKYNFFLLNETDDDDTIPTSSNKFKWILFSIVSLVLVLLFFLIIRFIFKIVIKLKDKKQYELLKYHVKQFNNLEEYFQTWNVNYFLQNEVYVTSPATLDYIQFNFHPFQEIELQHHEL
jgi:hypothetical protein